MAPFQSKADVGDAPYLRPVPVQCHLSASAFNPSLTISAGGFIEIYLRQNNINEAKLTECESKLRHLCCKIRKLSRHHGKQKKNWGAAFLKM